ncbi:hypothetical protein MLD38_011114 [Melastoma candidum]|uniref:Uncharacterized protein n=1 Tax=Melastoma candidum TaxID=119954 RepID=A0ACB9R2J6_9MYRT|nr:hypothetical protein MLD38_011114 [Melastoma candidum]
MKKKNSSTKDCIRVYDNPYGSMNSDDIIPQTPSCRSTSASPEEAPSYNGNDGPSLNCPTLDNGFDISSAPGCLHVVLLTSQIQRASNSRGLPDYPSLGFILEFLQNPCASSTPSSEGTAATSASLRSSQPPRLTPQARGGRLRTHVPTASSDPVASNPSDSYSLPHVSRASIQPSQGVHVASCGRPNNNPYTTSCSPSPDLLPLNHEKVTATCKHRTTNLQSKSKPTSTQAKDQKRFRSLAPSSHLSVALAPIGSTLPYNNDSNNRKPVPITLYSATRFIFSPNQWRLIFAGKQLEDGRTFCLLCSPVAASDLASRLQAFFLHRSFT